MIEYGTHVKIVDSKSGDSHWNGKTGILEPDNTGEYLAAVRLDDGSFDDWPLESWDEIVAIDESVAFDPMAPTSSDDRGPVTKVYIPLESYEYEQRITNALTGGQKGRKLARFGLIPAIALRALARHYGIGAIKYDDSNWAKGYDWDLSIDAIERHLNAWRRGESVYLEEFEKDGVAYEIETHHLIAVAWQAFTLYVFEKLGLGTDTRILKDA